MLSRVLEPEVIEDCREAIEYAAIDHREVNAAFVTDLLAAAIERGVLSATADDPDESDSDLIDVLDLGTGPADIPIALCRSRPDVRVLGVDLSSHMLDLAIANIDRARLRQRIRLERADAKEMENCEELFAIVCSNSLIHHLPDPRSCLRQAWRVAAPGGMLFMRDLIRPADEQELSSLVDLHAAAGTDAQKRMFSNSLCAALAVEEVSELTRQCGWQDAEVRRTSDRHWTLLATRI